MSTDPRRKPPEHTGPFDWPDSEYDAALHLLDRQIVDVDGMLVGKVDDVELAEDPDGTLVPTALMVGTAALLPRIGDRLGQWLHTRYVRLAPADADRSRPGIVELDLVDDVTSEVRLTVGRDGLLRRRADGDLPRPVRRRLGQLLRMRVDLPPEAGDVARGPVHVLDVRLGPAPDRPGTQRVTALVVGRGRPGSLLGYERSPGRGPWLVARIVRRIHHHTRLVRVERDVRLDWDEGRVRVGPGADVAPFD